MRKIMIITGCVALAVTVISCGSDIRRSEGRAYMPDMSYSKALETYSMRDTAKFTTERSSWGSNDHTKIFYNNMPVPGTIARGDLPAYTNKNDSTGYVMSASMKSQLDSSGGAIDMKEAQRLYLVNCAICHGTKLDGNGPLYNDGNGPYTAKPATLVGDPTNEVMPEGRMFHVITYGKGAMGSYASQLNTKQRWMVVAYVKSKQGKAGAVAAPADSTAKAAPATGK